MIVRLALVMSIDGFIADSKDKSVSGWASKEDKQYFAKLKAASDLIVMGAATYDKIKDNVEERDSLHRLVLTQDISKFKAYQNEFTDFVDATYQNLADLIGGYQNVLISGGQTVYRQFSELDLVDEFHLTIEPLMLGDGKRVEVGFKKLKLLESKILNDNGTILLVYGRLKSKY